jgi:hypothetical protein
VITLQKPKVEKKSQNHGIEEWRFVCACVALARLSLSHDTADAHFLGFLWVKLSRND